MRLAKHERRRPAPFEEVIELGFPTRLGLGVGQRHHGPRRALAHRQGEGPEGGGAVAPGGPGALGESRFRHAGQGRLPLLWRGERRRLRDRDRSRSIGLALTQELAVRPEGAGQPHDGRHHHRQDQQQRRRDEGVPAHGLFELEAVEGIIGQLQGHPRFSMMVAR
ncbi:hypothetical protein D3C72_1524550 [compost metagenome]